MSYQVTGCPTGEILCVMEIHLKACKQDKNITANSNYSPNKNIKFYVQTIKLQQIKKTVINS